MTSKLLDQKEDGSPTTIRTLLIVDPKNANKLYDTLIENTWMTKNGDADDSPKSHVVFDCEHRGSNVFWTRSGFYPQVLQQRLMNEMGFRILVADASVGYPWWKTPDYAKLVKPLT